MKSGMTAAREAIHRPLWRREQRLVPIRAAKFYTSSPASALLYRLEAIMARFNRTLRILRNQRAAAQATIDRLDRAIQALDELDGKAPGRRGGPRHMSKAARKRIADAQRARWAKIRGERQKRNVSPAGRRRLSESARARWAASRKAHGDSLRPVRLLSKKEIAAMQENAAKAPATRAAKATGE